jgi:hypothetical protein
MRHTKRVAAGVASLALVVGAGAGLADAAQKNGGGAAPAPRRSPTTSA